MSLARCAGSLTGWKLSHVGLKMGLKERNKGANGEREVCALLRQWTGEEFERNLLQTREGGGDIPFGSLLLEVKRTERVKMPEWQEQAQESAKNADMLPAVVWRRSRAEWWIAMPLLQYLALHHPCKERQ